MTDANHETRQMLMPHEHNGSERECADDQCTRLIGGAKWPRNCFIDLLTNGQILCDNCGKCLRYARKMAVRRGEPIESALQTRH